ncbi:MAG: SMP-30/gluconolactonase/LRE family protein [Chloroflexota bacterium]
MDIHVRYPDPSVVVLDPRFQRYKLGNAAIERLWTGARWAEGPVWFGDTRQLIFSDIPNNRMIRWVESGVAGEPGQVSVFRNPSNQSNGNTRDRQGRLVTCEHATRRVTRTELDGSVTVLMDEFDGTWLNAPNDVVIKSDDSIWFTDPGYGSMMHYEGNFGPLDLPTRVYRIDAETGDATIIIEEMDKPNGLCFSPDESLLYVADSGAPRNIKVYDVAEDGKSVRNGHVFAEMGDGIADGMRVDCDGNLWSSAGWIGDGYDGVHIFAPDATMIGKILLPDICANVCFGGLKKNRLFMAGSRSLYSLYVEAIGI